MHLRWITLFLTSTLAFANPAFAHGHDQDDAETEALLARYAEIAKFSEQMRVTSAVTPFIEIAGEDLRVGGPFWNLVQAWVRLDYQAVQRDCDHCIPIPEYEFVAKAEGVMAKTYFQAQIAEPALEGFEHIVVGTADIGAQLGVRAAGAKVAAEIFETVVSKFLGFGGVHVLCHAIDIAIFVATRPTNTAINLFRWAPMFGGSRLLALLNGGFIAASIARAQRQVRFVKGPVTLDEDALRELDQAGPKRWWGWIPNGKRWSWVKKLDRDGEATVGRAQALGSRRPRFAFMRLSKKDLAGTTPMDRALNQKGPIWIMSVQENIAQKAFNPADVPTADEVETLAERHTPEHDDVRLGLAEEFGHGDDAKTRLMEGVLRDVEVIFNPDVPKRIRGFHAKTIESLLFGFMYDKNFRLALMHSGELYEQNRAPGYVGKLKAIFKQAALQWRAGGFAGYILDVSDVLFLASGSRKAEKLAAKKFEMLDAIKRIFETYELSRKIVDATDLNKLEALKSELGARRTELMTFRPWVEKITNFRRLFAWPPFTRPEVTCHEMARRVTL